MEKIYENDRVVIRPQYREGLKPEEYTGTAIASERIEGVWCFRVTFDDGGVDVLSERELELAL